MDDGTKLPLIRLEKKEKKKTVLDFMKNPWANLHDQATCHYQSQTHRTEFSWDKDFANRVPFFALFKLL